MSIIVAASHCTCAILINRSGIFKRYNVVKSDKYDSVNKRTQEVSKSMKLHVLGVWQNAHNLLCDWLMCECYNVGVMRFDCVASILMYLLIFINYSKMLDR